MSNHTVPFGEPQAFKRGKSQRLLLDQAPNHRRFQPSGPQTHLLILRGPSRQRESARRVSAKAPKRALWESDPGELLVATGAANVAAFRSGKKHVTIRRIDPNQFRSGPKSSSLPPGNPLTSGPEYRSDNPYRDKPRGAARLVPLSVDQTAGHEFGWAFPCRGRSYTPRRQVET